MSLQHPPDLGFPIQTAAFAHYEGECSDEFVNALIEDLVGHDVEVVERGRLGDVLEAIDLSISGHIRENDAVSLGEILGPSALIFVSTDRCTHDKSKSYKEYETDDGVRRTYYSTTKVYFKSSLRIVDLTTGRIFSSTTVDEALEDTNSASGGYPDYPDEYVLHDKMIDGAVEQVRRMILPWTEVKHMRFFRDKKCNLRAAYKMIEAGDYQGAVTQSMQNLEQCKSESKAKPKQLARAYYNLGMSYLLQGAHDEALGHFQHAQRVRPGPRISEAISESHRAKQLADDLRLYEDLAARSASIERSSLSERLAEVIGDKARSGQPGDRRAANSAPAPQDGKRSVTERLEELKALYDIGLLSAADFEAKKQDILKDL